MKNIAILSGLILSLFLITSCKKDKSPENMEDRVKTYTESITSSDDSYSMTLNLGYDSRNRIISIIPEVASEGKVQFTYPSSDHMIMQLYEGNSIQIQQDIFMRNSLLDSTIQYTSQKDTMSEKYRYTGTQLTSRIEYEHNGGRIYLSNATQYTYDASGNMIRSTDTDGNVETFTYYPELVYAMPVTLPFAKQLNKSALIKTYQFSRGTNVLESSVTTYTFDSRDRIESITETFASGIIQKKTFTYF